MIKTDSNISDTTEIVCKMCNIEIGVLVSFIV